MHTHIKASRGVLNQSSAESQSQINTLNAMCFDRDPPHMRQVKMSVTWLQDAIRQKPPPLVLRGKEGSKNDCFQKNWLVLVRWSRWSSWFRLQNKSRNIILENLPLDFIQTRRRKQTWQIRRPCHTLLLAMATQCFTNQIHTSGPQWFLRDRGTPTDIQCIRNIGTPYLHIQCYL